MYNDIFILLNNCIRTSVTSYLLSLYIVIGLIESNHCFTLRAKDEDYYSFLQCYLQVFHILRDLIFNQDISGDVIYSRLLIIC